MSPALPVVTGKQCIRALTRRRAGFYIHHHRGDHAQLRHRTNPELRVTVRDTSKELPRKTLASVLRQARLSREQFVKLL